MTYPIAVGDNLLRVNTDIIIDTQAAPRDVAQTVTSEGPRFFDQFPHGEAFKFDVLSCERVTDEEAHGHGWVE